MKLRTGIAVVVILAAVLAACGGDDDDNTANSNSTTTAAASTDTTATPTLPSTTTTTSPPSAYNASATPTEGLTDGATVTVNVSNFKAGLTLGINECAQQGDDQVGAEDCALDHIKTLTVGADGTGTGTTQVYMKNIGSAGHDCTQADTRCFLSVGELTDSPDAQRSDDIDLKFAS
jgi:hypothetical protein